MTIFLRNLHFIDWLYRFSKEISEMPFRGSWQHTGVKLRRFRGRHIPSRLRCCPDGNRTYRSYGTDRPEYEKSEEAVADWDTTKRFKPPTSAHGFISQSLGSPRARRVNHDFALLCPTAIERTDFLNLIAVSWQHPLQFYLFRKFLSRVALMVPAPLRPK